MNELQNAVDLFLSALFSIVLAILGTLARIGHERAHGIRATKEQMLWLLPMAVVLGIIGQTLGDYLRAKLGVETPLIGGAIAGAFGLLGPTYLTKAAELALGWLKPRGDRTDDGKKS